MTTQVRTTKEKIAIAKSFLERHGYVCKIPRKTNTPAPIKARSRISTEMPRQGYLRQPQVLAMFPVSSSTLWRMCTTGKFPAPVKLSERVTAWRTEEVLAWLAEKSDAEGPVPTEIKKA